MKAFAEAEPRKRPNPIEMFSDVYDELPQHLQRQMEEMKEHVMANKEQYPLEQYEKMP